MTVITLYHNPNCSKSRAALQWLEQQPITVNIVSYVSEPLSAHKLLELQQQLNLTSLREMMRTSDDLYHELKLDQASESELLQHLLQHPILMQRPIVQTDARAVIGRPLANIQALLNEHGKPA